MTSTVLDWGVQACAVLEDGGVSCWGGQHASRPRRVPGIRNAIDVSIDDEVVIVRADGSAVVVDSGDLNAPSHPFFMQNVRSVSQNRVTGCALRDDGRVLCWHRSEKKPPRPVEVKGLQDVVSVGAGPSHGCALLKDGRVACFGTLAKDAPYYVAGLRNVVELVVGMEEACARTSAREVTCFLMDPHKNATMRLGQGSAVAVAGTQTKGYGAKDFPLGCIASEAGVACMRLTSLGDDGMPPMSEGVVPDPRQEKARQLALLPYAGCLLTDKGNVRCWGDNRVAILGQPDPRYVQEPTVVQGLPVMRSVAAATRTTCGVSAAGDVLCWGAKDAQPRKIPGLGGTDRLIANSCCVCAFNAAGEATCFSEDERSPKRVAAVDRVRDIAFPYFGSGSIGAIGPAGEVLVGMLHSLGALQVSPIASVGTVQRIAVLPRTVVTKTHGAPGYLTTPKTFLVALTDKGAVMSVDVTDGAIGKPVRNRQLEGAVSLDYFGDSLMPGGKVIEFEVGIPHATIVDASPMVSFVGPFRCGLTAAGAFGCVEGGRFRTIFDGMRQIAAGDGHQCAIDGEGGVRCRGDNATGQCGTTQGLRDASTPVDVILPPAIP
ncbi:MAG: hypothetical protein HY898_06805 [Deltaproteobacteria bacterium]|nr:hypothetical protein [Deltaproteobacteria bacterium]